MNATSTVMSIKCDLFILVVQLFSTQKLHNRFEPNKFELKGFLPLVVHKNSESAAIDASSDHEKGDSAPWLCDEPVNVLLLISTLLAAMLGRFRWWRSAPASVQVCLNGL